MQEQLELLIKSQKCRIEIFFKFKTNYGKDGAIRKCKKEYFVKKLDAVQKWWLEFDKANHDLMLMDDKTDEYFTENVFETMQNHYKALREEMQQEVLVRFPEKQTNSTINGSTSAINVSSQSIQHEPDNPLGASERDNDDALGEQQNDPPVVRVLKHQIAEIQMTFEMANDPELKTSIGLATALSDNLKALWSDLRATHRNILMSETSIYCEQFNINQLQSNYLKICGKLNEYVKSKSDKANVILPKLKLAEFDGTTSWTEFKELFNEIVHNNPTLSNGAKVQYLKMSLKGKAAAVVSHLGPQEENYQTIYNLLMKRFDNKRKIVGELIDKFMELPNHSFETGAALRNMYDTTNECLMAIKNLDVETENWDPLIIHILMKKLSKTTILDYESKLPDVREVEKLEFFMEYIESRFMALTSAERGKVGNRAEKNQNKSEQVPFKCTYCEKNHSIYRCSEFDKLKPTEKNEWAKEKKSCFLCLQVHGKGECKSTFMCKKCGKKHNTLLHFEQKKPAVETKTSLIATASTSASAMAESVESTCVSTLISTKKEKNLLATAMIYAIAKNGEKVLLKAVVDPGSQSSMITEYAQQLLKLPIKKVCAEIDGFGESSQASGKQVSVTLLPRFPANYSLITEALVLKKITNLAVFKGDLQQYDYLQNLLYADPTKDDTKPIDLLIGVAEFSRIVKNGLIKGPEDAPIGMNTEFGWLIMGPQTDKKETKQTFKVSSLISNVEIEEKLKNFFTSENINDDDDSDNEHDEKNWTDEERFCEQYFLRTTKRDNFGRFTVSMPFRNDTEPVLGDSRRTAIATLLQLEKRFEKNQKLRNDYSEAINDALKRGHMKICEKTPANAHFLPHHPVFKNSTTTKLRTVFNASQRTSNGLSLNEQLATGKIMQPSIFELSLRWRTYKIAVIGDIEKMYKQIMLAEDQQHLQMIVWRNSPCEKIREYKLTTVTFGLVDAPYLAIRTLKALADAVATNYPLASHAIKNNFYVDDHTGGTDTVYEAIELYEQLKKAFNSAGWNLRKFISNSQELLKHIPEIDRELDLSSTVKVLGISWNHANDAIQFRFNIDTTTTPATKRELLSEIASMYDPLGIVSPIIISARIIVREIWQLTNENNKKENKKYGWDEKIPCEYVEKWKKIKSELPILENISVPRWIGVTSETKFELHGFCDASQDAYGAVLYVRVLNENNTINVTLLVSKTRVAPLKKLKIPRLELLATLLLANLTKKAIKAINIEFQNVHLWSDSKIALAWIKGDTKRWKSFVASRVTKINKKVNKNNWHHVAGKENPADCCSRGIFPNELKNHRLWWNGPSFLSEINYVIPDEKHFETSEEIKLFSLVATDNYESIIPIVSSFYKLKKVFAYVLRFIANCRTNVKRRDQISVSELHKATSVIVLLVQAEHFASELEALKNGKDIKKSSKVIKLCVFIDDYNIIRVGGRLKNAQIPFNMKHQILLPNKSIVTDLIIRETHLFGMHSGPKLTESLLRRNYWIVGGLRAIKRTIHRCVTCSIYSPKSIHQIMGDLPVARVNATEKAFMKCAIDFAGPIKVKANKLRNGQILKGYISIFVCMTTKAMHLEPVSDLTAVSFIAALRRFVSRRGTVTDIFSDNATNFIGANNILIELSEQERENFEKTLHEECNKSLITWHFSPPASPHFNGLAEAAVKSTKYHLKRVIGESALTFEELATLLCQIEFMVNSRPLCELTDDPNDVSTLTPAHFLNIVETSPTPDEDVLDARAAMLTNWQRVQQRAQEFWKRWQLEYLHQLQVRSKWTTKQPNIDVGKLVLLKDENLPSGKWTMGRVAEKHTGTDGKTCVVSVQTKNNIVKRSITKLAPLPIDCHEELIALLATMQKNKPTLSCERAIRKVSPVMKAVMLSTMMASLPKTACQNRYGLLNANHNISLNISQVNSEKYSREVSILILVTLLILFLGYIIWICWKGSKDIETRPNLNQVIIHRPMENNIPIPAKRSFQNNPHFELRSTEMMRREFKITMHKTDTEAVFGGGENVAAATEFFNVLDN